MKTYFLSLLVFGLFSFDMISQNNLIIEYGVDYLEFYKKEEYTKNISEDAKLYLQEHENNKKKAIQGDRTIFTLKVNEHSSLTDYLKFMEVDDQQSFILVKMATTISSTLKYGDQLYLVKGFLGQHPTFEPFDYQISWEIKGEYKEIMGYSCQLAEATIDAKIKVKRDQFKVKAWFTTEIPIQEGPSIYKGLPGLILGLEKHGRYIYATSINFPEELHIDVPEELLDE